MKKNMIYVFVTVSMIMVMSCAYTSYEKESFAESRSNCVTACDSSLRNSCVLQVYAGPLEFNSVNFLDAVQILKQNLKENNIYLSIVIDSKNIDLENTTISLKVEYSELENILDQFCLTWNGKWELITDKGPIVLKGSR